MKKNFSSFGCSWSFTWTKNRFFFMLKFTEMSGFRGYAIRFVVKLFSAQAYISLLETRILMLKFSEIRGITNYAIRCCLKYISAQSCISLFS